MTNQEYFQMKKDKGITLIELLVVIAIAGILFIALGFTFVGWQGKYKVESQTKDLYDDLMNARVRAMQRNRVHFLSLDSANQYTIYEDTNPAPDGDGTLQTAQDEMLPTYPKTIEYDLNWSGAVPSGRDPEDLIDFDQRGITAPQATPLGGTICIFTDFDGDGVSDSDPDYDCIIISRTRINMGKLNTQIAGECDADHCDAK
jgi:prepilin-type N-terminal cleavage/methylation domain-containing protein